MLLGLSFNWVDILILLVSFYFAFEGYRIGFLVFGIDFLSFLGALIFSFATSGKLAIFLIGYMPFSNAVTRVLSFIVLAIVAEVVISKPLDLATEKLQAKQSRVNKLLGLIPALGEAGVLISFALVIAMALPIKPSVKQSISNSQVGSLILTQTTRLEASVDDIFGDVIKDSLVYLL